MSTDEPTTQGRLASAERPIADLMREIGKAARAAAQRLSVAPSELKNRALLAAAAALPISRMRSAMGRSALASRPCVVGSSVLIGS